MAPTKQNLHIVIVAAVYPPEPVVSARMAEDLATALVGQGNRVTVLCPQPTRPASADYHLYIQPDAPLLAVENGIEVVRLPSYAAVQSRVVPRLRESWSFGWHVCRYLKGRRPSPDVLYVNSWPLLAQFQIIRYAVTCGVPTALQIMDVYPESLLGRLPRLLRGVVSWPLKNLDSWYSKKADALVVISDSMRRIYLENRGVAANRIATIPTWQDDAPFDSVPPRSEVCRRYGVSEEPFTFLYLGNIGPVAGVDLLIQAFHLAGLESAQLLIVGDGSAKGDCLKLTAHLRAAGVHFISDPDAANVPQLQSMAHVCLLPVKRGSAMTSIPSKLSAYLFSARPVLATVDPESDTAQVIREARCGWVGAPEDIQWLSAKMREVASLKQLELDHMGERGKKYGQEHFSKSRGVGKLAGAILDCHARRDRTWCDRTQKELCL